MHDLPCLKLICEHQRDNKHQGKQIHEKADDKSAQKLINETQHVKTAGFKIGQPAQTHLACTAASGNRTLLLTPLTNKQNKHKTDLRVLASQLALPHNVVVLLKGLLVDPLVQHHLNALLVAHLQQ